MKRFATLAFGLTLLASGSGCCCLGPMGGYGGGCQPCGGGAYAPAGMQSSPCGPGGCGGAYSPVGSSAAYYPGAVQQAAVPYQYQTTALNPNPVW